MLNDHPRRCFHKITLKNWRMLLYISSVRVTLQVLRQLPPDRSGQLLQELKSAHWFQLSGQLWAKKDEERSKPDASPSEMICWDKVPHWPCWRTNPSTGAISKAQRLIPKQFATFNCKKNAHNLFWDISRTKDVGFFSLFLSIFISGSLTKEQHNSNYCDTTHDLEWTRSEVSFPFQAKQL